ncbi:MAG: hypothetical protein C4311_05620 [Chloroflexota bacterium]
MQLARIIGTLVVTRKVEGLEGVKFLIAQPLDKQRRPKGDPVIVADATAQAGYGELVFIIGIREAALALPTPFVPVDHAVVGIVDRVDMAQGRQTTDDGLQRPSCPNPRCPDAGKAAQVIRYGRTRNGLQRYLCKTCHKSFSG